MIRWIVKALVWGVALGLTLAVPGPMLFVWLVVLVLRKRQTRRASPKFVVPTLEDRFRMIKGGL